MEFAIIYILASTTVVLPGISLWIILTSASSSPKVRFLNTAIAVMLFSAVWFAAPWILITEYLKYVWLAILALAIIRSGIMHTVRKTNGTIVLPIVFKIFLIAFLIFANFYIIKGFYPPKSQAVDISFPLKNGNYYVIQGGGSPVTNFFHNILSSQSFAMDIVKIDNFGRRATGILPRSNDKYQIFGDSLFCPCNGLVLAAAGQLQDNIPPFRNLGRSIGNYVILICEPAYIVMGHLKQGSITTKSGEFVREGTYLGQVGNSGRTVEPHLHIQANLIGNSNWYRGKPLPILFDGRFYSINEKINN